jgi:hypothetical protein
MPGSTTLLHGPDAIGEAKMAMVALFLFIGGVLGFRFKVLILIPAIILIVINAGAMEVAQRQDVWSSALTTLAAVIAVQVGYLGGVALGVVADHAVTTTQKADDRAPLGFVEWFSWFIHP